MEQLLMQPDSFSLSLYWEERATEVGGDPIVSTHALSPPREPLTSLDEMVYKALCLGACPRARLLTRVRVLCVHLVGVLVCGRWCVTPPCRSWCWGPTR